MTYTIEKEASEKNKGANPSGWFPKKDERGAGFLGPGRPVWGRGHSGHLLREGSGEGEERRGGEEGLGNRESVLVLTHDVCTGGSGSQA